MRKTTPEEIEASRDTFRELSSAIAALSGGGEVERFLRDLCTPSECVDLAKRWRLVQELLVGKSQRAIARELRMSLCKITRGARYVNDPSSVLRRCALASAEAPKAPRRAGRQA